MTPTSSEMSLTQKGYTNFFRVNANDTTQAQVDAAFLVNKLGAKTRRRGAQRRSVWHRSGEAAQR